MRNELFRKEDFPFYDALAEAAATVLRTHAAVEAVLREQACVQGPLALGEVLAIMHVSGGARGFLALGMSQTGAGRLVSALLGAPPDAVTPARLHDGAGELLNMITGNAKSMLADTPYHFNLTTPSSVVGRDCVVEHKMPVPRLVLTFDVFNDRLLLAAALQPLE